MTTVITLLVVGVILLEWYVEDHTQFGSTGGIFERLKPYFGEPFVDTRREDEEE